jgi:hypothetical protein
MNKIDRTLPFILCHPVILSNSSFVFLSAPSLRPLR